MAEDEIDDETIGSFGAVARAFKKAKPEEFKEWLKDLLPSSPAPEKGFDPLAFLTKERETLSEKLERALSLMTPEQLLDLRKGVQKEVEPGPDGLMSGAPPMKPSAPERPKKKWL